MDIRIYQPLTGNSPFEDWFDGLDAAAAAKVTTALTRLGLGNVSHVKGVGMGVFEIKIDFGPGYRVYFGKDGAMVAILLGGGSKKKQQRDIETAQDLWKHYKIQKKGKV